MTVTLRTLEFIRRSYNETMADCDLSIFDTDSPCSCCGSTLAASLRICSGQSMSGHVWKGTCMAVANYSHLHRQCPDCAYRWLEYMPKQDLSTKKRGGV